MVPAAHSSGRNAILGQLQKVEGLAGESTQVPVDLVRALDGGAHPDLWLRSQLRDLQARQQDSRKKAQAIRSFHDHLAADLGIQRLAIASGSSLDSANDEEIVVD